MCGPRSIFKPEDYKFFLFMDKLYIMQCIVFYYRLMTHRLEDNKSEKEINKFQKHPFTYVLQNRSSQNRIKQYSQETSVLEFLPATLVKRDSNTVFSFEYCEKFQRNFFL